MWIKCKMNHCYYSILICFIFFLMSFKMKINDSFVKAFSVIWFCYLSIYELSSNTFVSVSSNFDFIFLIFFFGVILFYLLTRELLLLCNFSIYTFVPIIKKDIFYFISFCFFLFSTISFIYYIYLYGIVGFRQFFLENDLSLHVGMSFPFCAGSYFLARYINDKTWERLFLILMFILAIISTSKIFVVLSILFVSGFYEKSFKLNIKKLFIVLSVALIFFFSLHLFMGKIAGQSKFSIFGAVLFTLQGYLLGGLAVFQLQLDNAFTPTDVYNSLYNFLSHTPESVTTVVNNGWVKTGQWVGNVYSGFSEWYAYASTMGIILLSFFIGFFHAVINYFSKVSLFFRFLRVLSYYSLFFFIFSDTYLRAFPMYVSFSIAAFFITITKKDIKI